MSSNSEGSDRHVDEWLAGTAEAIITPEESMWMAGFGARNEPSQGVHLDLYAKALALEDRDGARAVIVNVEILFVSRSMRAAIVERIEEAYGIDPSRVLLNASHTHQGPATRTATEEVETDGGDTKLVPKADGAANFIVLENWGLDAEYREKTLAYRSRLEDTIVELVGEALDDRDEADLSYSFGHCGSAKSRRRPYEGGYAFSPYSGGKSDHEVPVLIVEDPDGEGDDAVRALLFGYACHTTVQMLSEFSGDWAGYTQRFLEDRFENATAIFLQGCGGDQKAYPQDERGFEPGSDDPTYAKAHGRAVALGVEAALESVRYPVHGPLQAAYEDVDLAFEGPPSRAELEAAVESGDASWKQEYWLDLLEEEGEIPTEYPYPVQALGFGTDLKLVALAGEVLPGYSLRLKKELEGNVWVAGYSNNAFTYVPTRQALAEGGYEGDRALSNTTLPGLPKHDMEDTIVLKAKSLAERVSKPPYN
jgi:hypothetical protein